MLERLLRFVRPKTAQENRDREAKFAARKGEQSSLLSAARSELATLERKANSVQSTFDGNQNRISRLEGQLKAAQGDFGEVFGLARAKAGEFKAILDNSLITAEYPTRTAVLKEVSESKALPNTDQLNAIWQTMLGEIQAQRQVTSFEAPVALEAGTTPILLALLPKQPGGAVNSAASNVANASAGSLVFAPIDPTRGGLLASFERVPDVGERIAQGGKIGLIKRSEA